MPAKAGISTATVMPAKAGIPTATVKPSIRSPRPISGTTATLRCGFCRPRPIFWDDSDTSVRFLSPSSHFLGRQRHFGAVSVALVPLLGTTAKLRCGFCRPRPTFWDDSDTFGNRHACEGRHLPSTVMSTKATVMPAKAGIPPRGRTFPATALSAPRREEPAAPQRLRTAKAYIFGTVLV